MKKSLELSKKTYLSKRVEVSEILAGAYKFKTETQHILKTYGFLTEPEPDPVKNAYDTLENILLRFHRVASQLKFRYNNRTTLEINDEYDVQDLLHSLFLEHFRDVRAEEYTPSYAGSSTRTDFLLKAEKIFVEVKKTRKSMNDKSLGNDLIIDKAQYKSHPECDSLFCFVYDPDAILKKS